MKFKMRVVHEAPGELSSELAHAISREQKTTNDSLPPSYPIQNERLLFIGVETKGSSINQSIVNFCKDLDFDRVRNVVFFVVAPKSGRSADLTELKSIIKANGINVIDNDFVCTVDSGLFKKAKITEADLQSAAVWSNEVTDTLLKSM